MRIRLRRLMQSSALLFLLSLACNSGWLVPMFAPEAIPQTEPLSPEMEELIPASREPSQIRLSPDGAHLLVAVDHELFPKWIILDVETGVETKLDLTCASSSRIDWVDNDRFLIRDNSDTCRDLVDIRDMSHQYLDLIVEQQNISDKTLQLLGQASQVYQIRRTGRHYYLIALGNDVKHIIIVPHGDPVVESTVPDLPNLLVAYPANGDPEEPHDRFYSPDGQFYATVRPDGNLTRVDLYSQAGRLLTEANYTRSYLSISAGGGAWGFAGWAYDSSRVFLFYESGDFDPQSPVYKFKVPANWSNLPTPSPVPLPAAVQIVLPAEQMSPSMALSPDGQTLVLGPRTNRDFDWRIVDLQAGGQRTLAFPCQLQPAIWINESWLYAVGSGSVQRFGKLESILHAYDDCHYLIDVQSLLAVRLIALNYDTCFDLLEPNAATIKSLLANADQLYSLTRPDVERVAFLALPNDLLNTQKPGHVILLAQSIGNELLLGRTPVTLDEWAVWGSDVQYLAPDGNHYAVFSRQEGKLRVYTIADELKGEMDIGRAGKVLGWSSDGLSLIFQPNVDFWSSSPEPPLLTWQVIGRQDKQP